MRILLFFFCFCFAFSFVSADQIWLSQERYFSGQTVQAYVENVSVQSSMIVLFDAQIQKVSISPLFLEYREGLTLVYFDLPETLGEGNYTLSVAGLEQNFTVLSGSSVFRVKPGIILLDPHDDTFSLTLSSVSESVSVTIVSSEDLLPRKTLLELGENEQKTLYVDYDSSVLSSDLFLNLSSSSGMYMIPVIYTQEESTEQIEVFVEQNLSENVQENMTLSSSQVPFVFLITKPDASVVLERNQSRSADLKVQNIGTESLFDLMWSLTGDLALVVRFNVTELPSLAPGEIYSQRVWFNPTNNSRTGDYNGLLLLQSGVYSQNISVFVQILASPEGVSEEVLFENQTFLQYENFSVVPFPEEEENGTGVYILGGILIFLLLVFIALVLLKLRQRDEQRFHEYIESTRRKK